MLGPRNKPGNMDVSSSLAERSVQRGERQELSSPGALALGAGRPQGPPGGLGEAMRYKHVAAGFSLPPRTPEMSLPVCG